MKTVHKSVLIWYSADEMYALVTDVAKYPEFLPWCDRSRVLEQDPAGMTAQVGLSFGGLRQSFTTRNTHVPGREVHLKLVDGPFSQLDGLWRFVPLPVPGAAAHPGTASACKIEFELRYAFANGLLDAAISPVFDKIAGTFVDSFVRRAEQVHGPR